MSVERGRGPSITLSSDNMQAYLNLPVPPVGENYKLADILALLELKGVRYGIDEEEIQRMIDSADYQRDCKVASGTPVVNGIDGYYEYFFSQEFSKKPKILPDGSADYRQMKLIETVSEGQAIAKYHPAVEGSDGVNVKGAPQIAKRVRELPPLKGKGFVCGEDGVTYTSEVEGKIEMRKDRIDILPFYELPGNAGIESGNINFSGDVVIHGAVENGIEIRSGGTITIDGIVEGATLIAAKDVVLKSGMLGGTTGSITTKGSLFAKFVEYTKLEVEGNIEAEVLLNCRTWCKGAITATGKRSAIIGGSTTAIQGVIAGNLGSDGEVKTHVKVGVGDDTYRRGKILERQIDMTTNKLEEIEKELNLLMMVQQKRELSPKEGMQKMQLLREKIKNSAIVSQGQIELEQLKNMRESSRRASVKVFGSAYPGVEVIIDDIRVIVKEVQENLEFVKQLDRVIMESLEGEQAPA